MGQAAAGLAAAMGVGRFAFTPILPLMTAGSALTASQGAALATANYGGYLAGAVAGIAAPDLIRQRRTLRGALLALTTTLALMPLAHAVVTWAVLRFLAGAASALVFMAAAAALFAHLSSRRAYLTGWGFGGVGAGIATSGLAVLAVGQVSSWQAAWWVTAGLAALFTFGAWNLEPEGPHHTHSTTDYRPPDRLRFTTLTMSYTLEGIGYIIAGTFLVAAVDDSASRSTGAFTWVVVGLAATPSAAIWTWLSVKFSQLILLPAALALQAIGVLLPALSDGIAAAVVSAVLFGSTFIGISTLCLSIGNRLRVPRAVAILTTGYSLGQILGPLAVTPLLSGGYRTALIIGAAVILAAAMTSTALRDPSCRPTHTP
ncbi:YbfB/YjiJ family MFS transporter [Streptomyces sp. WAC 04229]|uniref:YbfB/YjiJ family MFS transporter n=1 Tax=Streptomyces sp. WAC 04229 TaxID=2203206 RepID=UPI003D74445C